MTARKHHRFSVDQYEQMIRVGILDENDRVELIHGEIVTKMSIGDKHMACVKRLSHLFWSRLAAQVLVSVQDPIRLPDSEPEPDIALLVPKPDFYASGKPGVADTLLVIEVGDSSVDYDRDIKMPMYAQAGIRELWLVDVINERVEVYRHPTPQGKYAPVQVLSRGQKITIAALPGVEVAVSEIL